MNLWVKEGEDYRKEIAVQMGWGCVFVGMAEVGLGLFSFVLSYSHSFFSFFLFRFSMLLSLIDGAVIFGEEGGGICERREMN